MSPSSSSPGPLADAEGFELALRTRVVFGAGCVERVGELAVELGARRALLVTDPGIVAAGYATRVERACARSGVALHRFDRVRENPTTVDVDACLAALGDRDVDLLIGLGGGSSIDVAKGCNFVRAGGGRMEDYWGIGKANGDLLPLIAIPTTAGTGTEVQSFALIGQEESHQKMACGDVRAAPAVALLDPTLTVSKPLLVTACTGLDAIGHAVETAVTLERTPFSALFSFEAFRLAQASLPRILAAPDDLEPRGRMLLAATYAGIAIEHSMLGAAHSMANPLTAHHDLAHGHAVGLALPHVVRFNAQQAEIAPIYGDLARRGGLCAADDDDDAAIDALVARLESLLDAARVERSLAALGVDPESIDALAEEAARQWTAQFNPRPVTADDFRALFRCAL